VELDGSAFGNDIQWNTGSANPKLNVSQGGIFTLKAGNTCEEVVVSHDVTSASCPYTIRVSHTFFPDSTFPCDDVIFRFVFVNDSGEPRKKLSFSDTLPAGFTFKKLLDNPFGGNLQTDLLPGIIRLDGMNMKPGKDTLDVLVEVGDVAPGTYRNQGKLFNLPVVMGPSRLSDDPNTTLFDSSALYVLGTWADTLYFRDAICPDAELVLDASDLGKSFLWQDGSVAPEFRVTAPGEYHLTVLDGCEPAEVFWQIEAGTPVEILPVAPLQIHQGESVLLEPLIVPQSDSLVIVWTDPAGSLSCDDCPGPVAAPLQTTLYGLRVFNGICSDSIAIAVEVDKTRRIFAANVFSPNDDGLNDFFYLQSPDPGTIRSLRVFDRWGNVLFFSNSSDFNELSEGWDGSGSGQKMPPGVYLWQAEVEFPDGERKVYAGDVTIVK
jgi:gliding motility-associated-like protein